jgi:hypothetical protein
MRSCLPPRDTTRPRTPGRALYPKYTTGHASPLHTNPPKVPSSHATHAAVQTPMRTLDGAHTHGHGGGGHGGPGMVLWVILAAAALAPAAAVAVVHALIVVAAVIGGLTAVVVVAAVAWRLRSTRLQLPQSVARATPVPPWLSQALPGTPPAIEHARELHLPPARRRRRGRGGGATPRKPQGPLSAYPEVLRVARCETGGCETLTSASPGWIEVSAWRGNQWMIGVRPRLGVP